MGDPLAESSALLWAITAMSEATARLPQAGIWDRSRAYAAVGEAVWWVTLVDATMVRHHAEVYEAVLAGQSAAQRKLIEGTLAGLRFVRNRTGADVGFADFIHAAAPGPGAGNGRITGWRVEAGAAAGAGLASAAGAVVGDDPIPGLPGAAGGPHHRRDLPAGGDVPHADSHLRWLASWSCKRRWRQQTWLSPDTDLVLLLLSASRGSARRVSSSARLAHHRRRPVAISTAV
jgi:hypothetical protein